MDIILQVMRNAADLKGIAPLISRLAIIAADMAGTAPDARLGQAALNLALDLETALVRFQDAVRASQHYSAYSYSYSAYSYSAYSYSAYSYSAYSYSAYSYRTTHV